MKKCIVCLILIFTILAICCVLAVYFNSNYYHSKLLVTAIRMENDEKIAEVLERKPSSVNEYPSAIPSWLRDILELPLLEYPLVEACKTGNIEIVKILLVNHADVNLGKRFTPLSITYHQKPQNWYEISQLLLDNGAFLDYESQNSQENVLTEIVGTRPGLISDKHGQEKPNEVEQAFYYAIENCDHKKIEWMRVLQHSVSNDRIEIVKFLLDNEYCQVNDNSVGMTALMFASRDSTTEMVQLLLDYGADKTIARDDGKTALDYAIKRGNEEIIALLSN